MFAQSLTNMNEEFSKHPSSVELFVGLIQELSLCKNLECVTKIVRTAARQLMGADGATFVLKDGEYCFYADEDAIGPLWKGQRFPLNHCISGWAMLNRKAVIIPDITQDSRIPIDAYRPTFVKSLIMVPIRTSSPIGAIGAYWATMRTPTEEERRTLQALADTTSVAMENLQLYSDLQTKVKDLKSSNEELSRFAWMASHDFKEPLRTMSTYMGLLEGDAGDKLNEEEKEYIHFVEDGAQRLHRLIDNLTAYLDIERTEMKFQEVSLMEAVQRASHAMIQPVIGPARAHLVYEELPHVNGDLDLLTKLFSNLFSNAIKFKRTTTPEIRVRSKETDLEWLIEVEDNGIGIEKKYFDRVFELFRRLHPQDEYPGSGVGLAISKKIVELHHGRIWVDSKVGHGTKFTVSLPKFRF